ncbi:MAG TPA: RNA degradosome polyphosphate kinase [Mycobacteriales bacterium]|nr:RNA degradosome polyphosphate kinase [Mycobacteriales bacterium]
MTPFDDSSLEPTAALPDDRFLNREMSWLKFNERVLALAEDPATPLLERVKFLAIFAQNLDEFFMVRVAGLRRRLATRIAVTSADGLQPKSQLELICRGATELSQRHDSCFLDLVLPELVKQGIDVLRWDELSESERTETQALFREQVFPVLSPLAFDVAHPFPNISGLSLNIAVILRDPTTGDEHFARVKVPPLLSRFASVGSGHFVPLEDIIAAHLSELFPGMTVLQTHSFRVTRNADLEVDDDDAEDMIQALEQELLRRRFGPPVRLEVEQTMDDKVLRLLMRQLDIEEADVYRFRGPLDLSGLWALYAIDRPELKDPPFVPATNPALAEGAGGIFTALRAGDVLVHHPYESFQTSVQAFVEQAAADPKVLAIKQTLYRTDGRSGIVDALIDAAEAGKQVVVIVEVKARFDEQANIRWARALEEAGCHVVYGVVGLKTHCKIALVVRQEGTTLRRYAHIGTGNYNARTAGVYEDVGLMTADPLIGSDLTYLFNRLTGYSRHTDYRRLLVAPTALRQRLIALIDRQSARHAAGEASRIVLKVNSLTDEACIDALYAASRAGVVVDLLVRGMCALRPGVPGLSETIRVRSVVGRFLEHSRIFAFPHLDEADVFIGSADLMHRNLDRRVEVLVQVTAASGRELLRRVDLAFRPDIAAWELRPDGRWERSSPPPGTELVGYQELMLEQLTGTATDTQASAG